MEGSGRTRSALLEPAIWPATVRWAVLIAGSAIGVGVLELLRLPAALLLGPMAMAILIAVNGGKIGLPKVAFTGSQSLIGIMIAMTLPPGIFGTLASQWLIFVLGVLATAIAASSLGFLMVRARVFPGTTAIWGSSPGAAQAMVLMAESYGADMRLVAFMQYIRVVCCALAATIVARLFGVTPGDTQQVSWFAAVPLVPAVATLALAFASAAIAMRLKIPAGAMLGPLAAGFAAKLVFDMPLVLPPWLLAICYALVGWTVGGRFTMQVVSHAAKNLGRVLLSTLSLIAICGVFAAVLVFATGIDPLTAYLATSPGGADSVAIISASTNVDVPFVMAMQIARFLFILATGPAIAKLLSTRQMAAQPTTT